MKTLTAADALTGLGRDRDGNAVVYHPAVAYECDECGASSCFDLKVKTHRIELASQFETATGVLTNYEEDYCDFDCSGCGAHVRCVYAYHELSMARYEYYPARLFVIQGTGQPSVQREDPPSSSRRLWKVIALMLGFALAVLAVFTGD